MRRVLAEMGHSWSVGRVVPHTTGSRAPHRAYPHLIQKQLASYPDQVWVANITYLRWHYRFIYLAVILGLYIRGVRSWWLSRSLDQQLTLRALIGALTTRQPAILHSNQGSQYTAHGHIRLLHSLGVRISMTQVGPPIQNAVAGRFNRTSK